METMFLVLAMVFIAEMGDKSQFLLVAMASKYKVRDIMIGTALAIAVLNAIAIGLGAALGNILPTECISVIAGIAFFFFALSSIGGEEEEEEVAAGSGKGAIFKVFGTFFIAELGDKTQLAALTVSAEQGCGCFQDALWIWLGACIGLYLADMMGLLVGIFLKKQLPDRIFAWISFFLFSIFGVVKLFSGVEIFCGEQNKVLAIAITSAVTIIFAGLCILKLKKAKSK